MPDDRQIDELRRANILVRRLQECPAARRREILNELADTDPDLYTRVHGLLNSLESDQGRGETGPESRRRIGGYELVRSIGQGGSSQVYLARQTVGEATRTVAVKILRGNTGSAGLHARLGRERRILSRLQHPNIASIHDLGATTDGHPYLVMEYVEGDPLDRWHQTDRPSLTERLRVFLAVAGAVAYAHQHLVIHRDIKPGNILIDRTGRPRLLDFGIAKILDESEGVHEITSTNALPLTLPFASPELLAGEPADVTSDVYQLGALLYLLLTGKRPFSGHSQFALWNAILAGDFTPPGIASGERVPEELEAIVLKAMDVSPAGRYPTAGRLIDDVTAFLEGRPVAATNRGRLYRTGKFVRRHLLAVSLGTGLVAVIILFAVSVTLFSIRLDGARMEAVSERNLSEAALDFLVGTFRSADPARARGRSLAVGDILDQGTRELETRLGDNPRLRYRIHVALGEVYESIERYETAEMHFSRALELVEQKLAPDTAGTLPAVLSGLGRNAFKNGRIDQAERYYRRILALTGTDGTIWQTRAYASLAVIVQSRGGHEQALELSEQAVRAFDARLGPDDPDSIKARYNLAQLLLIGDGKFRSENLAHAEDLLADAARRAERTLDHDHPLSVQLRLHHFRCQVLLDKHAAAIDGLRDTIPVAARILGESHLSVLHARRYLAMALMRTGKPATGRRLLEEAVTTLDETYPGAQGDRAEAYLDLAESLAGIPDLQAAARALETARALGARADDITARSALRDLLQP